MVTKKMQRGMTVWGMAAIMAMAGSLALIALRLFPVYYDDFKANKALEALKTNNEEGSTRDSLVHKFANRLMIDDVSGVHPEDLKLVPKEEGGFSMVLDYEVRVPIAYNVDAVVKFTHHQDIR